MLPSLSLTLACVVLKQHNAYVVIKLGTATSISESSSRISQLPSVMEASHRTADKAEGKSAIGHKILLSIKFKY